MPQTVDQGVNLLHQYLIALTNRGWKRSRIDTLISPDGTTVRHHFANQTWSLFVDHAGHTMKTVRFTTTSNYPTVEQLLADTIGTTPVTAG